MNEIYNEKYTSEEVIQWNEWGDLKCLQKPTKSILMEAYSQTLWTWVGRNAGEWNGRGCYNENECEMEIQKPGQKSQRRDVKAWNRLSIGNDLWNRWVSSLEWNWDVDRSRSEVEPQTSMRRMDGRLAKFFWKGIPKNRCSVSKWSVSYLEAEETVGRLRVTVVEERVRVSDWICRRLCR